MKITEAIREAIGKAVEEAGSQGLLAQKIGIAPQNLSKYLTGRVKAIQPRTFQALQPYLAKYLPEQKSSLDAVLKQRPDLSRAAAEAKAASYEHFYQILFNQFIRVCSHNGILARLLAEIYDKTEDEELRARIADTLTKAATAEQVTTPRTCAGKQ